MSVSREVCINCGARLLPDQETCARCGTSRPTGNRPDLERTARRVSRGRFGRSWTQRWFVAACVLEIAVIIFFAGVLTGWFGLGAANSGPSANAGPNPNPFSEPVTRVSAALTYTGNGSGYLTISPSGNICSRCPLLPTEDLRFGSPIATLQVFLNLSNTGGSYHEIANWTVLTMNYNGPDPFYVRAVLCCAPNYVESADLIGVVPGDTLALAILIAANEIPSNQGQGFQLEFHANSPD
ncbi:MAG TPA: hypothetical protein VFG07_02390 [Thermoplasmata archaeon]|nr:hypothetical protein [Thermoplasmata archaeon]